MAQQTIDIGSVANDGTGDPLRDAFGKANDNFIELYTGRIYVLAQSAVQVSHTGNTNETTFATITIPAGLMGANGQVIVEALYSMTGTNSKTPRIRFGGTLVSGAAATTSLSGQYRVRVANRNAANSQVFTTAAHLAQYGVVSLGVSTSAVNTALSTDITLTGQLTNTGESITLESYQVLIAPKA